MYKKLGYKIKLDKKFKELVNELIYLLIFNIIIFMFYLFLKNLLSLVY
jgi:hypothetical protein